MIPSRGITSTTTWTTDDTPVKVSPLLNDEVALSQSCCVESHVVAMIRGRFISTRPSSNTKSGTTINTQAVTATRTQRLSTVTFSSVVLPGTMLRRIGPMRENRSGTPVKSATM